MTVDKQEGFELNRLGLWTFATLIVALTIWVTRGPSDESADHQEELVSEYDPPLTIPAGSLDTQRNELAADFAFELPQDPNVRIFVILAGGHNFTATGYRNVGSAYRVLHPTIFPTGFHPPELLVDPPRLVMRERRLGVLFTFDVREDELLFEAE